MAERPVRPPSSPAQRRQQGLGLISAIGLIVLVSVVSAALAALLTTQAASSGQDVLRIRALAAAESGAEMALNRVFAPAGTGTCGTVDLSFTLDGLRGCSVNAVCTVRTVRSETLYDVASTGRCGAGSETATRQLVVRAVAP